MESGHIDNRKLYEVVAHQALLSKTEIEHLKSCEECLEMIRVLVRQQISEEQT
jgi:hypothetical protein